MFFCLGRQSTTYKDDHIIQGKRISFIWYQYWLDFYCSFLLLYRFQYQKRYCSYWGWVLGETTTAASQEGHRMNIVIYYDRFIQRLHPRQSHKAILAPRRRFARVSCVRDGGCSLDEWPCLPSPASFCRAVFRKPKVLDIRRWLYRGRQSLLASCFPFTCETLPERRFILDLVVQGRGRDC